MSSSGSSSLGKIAFICRLPEETTTTRHRRSPLKDGASHSRQEPLREGKSVREMAAMTFKDEANYRNAIDKDEMD